MMPVCVMTYKVKYTIYYRGGGEVIRLNIMIGVIHTRTVVEMHITYCMNIWKDFCSILDECLSRHVATERGLDLDCGRIERRIAQIDIRQILLVVRSGGISLTIQHKSNRIDHYITLPIYIHEGLNINIGQWNYEKKSDSE